MIEGIKDIISSGILERYATGDASIEERLKVDMLKVDHREIRDRISEIELEIEQQHLASGITPPLGTKEAIIRKLNSPDKELEVNQGLKKEWDGFKSWLSIAAAVLISVTAVWALMSSDIEKLEKENENLISKLSVLERECDEQSLKYVLLNDKSTQPILLQNINDQRPQAIAYWNTELQSSLLRTVDLPQLPADKIYQIWADVNGEMISVGLFTPQDDMIRINYLAQATSLNITIEPVGGSKHPTLSTLTASKSI